MREDMTWGILQLGEKEDIVLVTLVMEEDGVKYGAMVEHAFHGKTGEWEIFTAEKNLSTLLITPVRSD